MNSRYKALCFKEISDCFCFGSWFWCTSITEIMLDWFWYTRTTIFHFKGPWFIFKTFAVTRPIQLFGPWTRPLILCSQTSDNIKLLTKIGFELVIHQLVINHLGNFFLSGRFLYFKFWNSDTVDFEMKWFNKKVTRFKCDTLLFFRFLIFSDFGGHFCILKSFLVLLKSMFYRLSNLGVPPFWPTSHRNFYVFHYNFYFFTKYKPDTW